MSVLGYLVSFTEAGYEVTVGARKAPSAGGYYATLEHLDLAEPEEFYDETIPGALRRAHAWVSALAARGTVGKDGKR